MIERSNYIERLKPVRDKQIIKILTGVRRCGKSTILEMFRELLVAEGIETQRIQEYNFEDLSNEELKDYGKLHETIVSKLVPNKMNYIFLDEIQLVSDFEKVLDSLFIRKHVDLYVTGSNAQMLSGELATLISGRYIEIEVYPLSFAEYYFHMKKETEGADKIQLFQRYLNYGGFPFGVQIADDKTHKDYIDGVINTVLVKDVLARKKLSDATLVKQMATFLTDASGNLVTVKKIADTLTSMGQKTTSDTVLSYLNGFCEAFLFYKCDRFDVSGKRYLSINSKFYTVDQALWRSLLGTKRPNIGSRLESVIYMELLRRGYEVFVGVVGKGEVDFVAKRDGVTLYIQVSASVVEERTYLREVSSLKEIKDHYRKTLLTMDLGSYNDDGIEQINIIDWLLEPH